MKNIIVGLGNKGEEYVHTRHNAGWMILEGIREAYGMSSWNNDHSCKASVAVGEIVGRESLLVMPQSFMNLSGKPVRCILDREHAPRLIVVHDDIDLPRGKLRISFGRGSGGHRGVESIVSSLGGTYDFVRIRLGVSPTDDQGVTRKPSGEAAVEKFVLGEMSKAEKGDLLSLVPTIVEALAVITQSGPEAAMNQCN